MKITKNDRLLWGLIVAMCTLACSCKETSSGPAPTPAPVTGKIEGWQPAAYNTTLYVLVSGSVGILFLDSARVSDDGSFSIGWPFPVPPTSSLRHFLALKDSTSGWIKTDTRTCSNPNAWYAQASWWTGDRGQILIHPYAGSSYVTADSLVRVGDYRVQYLYFSAPTAITGQYKFTFTDSSLIRDFHRATFVTDFTVNVPAGWSPITTRIVADDGYTRTFDVSAGDVAGKKWFPSDNGAMGFGHAGSL